MHCRVFLPKIHQIDENICILTHWIKQNSTIQVFLFDVTWGYKVLENNVFWKVENLEDTRQVQILCQSNCISIQVSQGYIWIEFVLVFVSLHAHNCFSRMIKNERCKFMSTTNLDYLFCKLLIGCLFLNCKQCKYACINEY